MKEWFQIIIIFIRALRTMIGLGRARMGQRKGSNKPFKKVTEPDIIERCILATGGVGLHQKCD